MRENSIPAKLQLVGFNDEVTECDRCGRTELRGTARMIDCDGNEYRLGSTCATKHSDFRITRQDGLKARARDTEAIVNEYRAAKRALAAGDLRIAKWCVDNAIRFYFPTPAQRAQLEALVA